MKMKGKCEEQARKMKGTRKEGYEKNRKGT